MKVLAKSNGTQAAILDIQKLPDQNNPTGDIQVTQ